MSRKRSMLLGFVIAVIFIVAVFISFATNLLLRKTPAVVLPDLSGSSTSDLPGQGNSPNGSYLAVDVTPETVQAVIQTLARPESYARDMTVDLYWDEGQSSQTTVKVWQDDGYTRIEVTPPTGLTQYNLTDGKQLYRWYAGSRSYVTLPLDGNHSADLAQRIPTYEEVLDLPTESITDAGYEFKQDIPCIYAAVTERNVETRYWISLQNGLLVGAERLENGKLAYAMQAYAPLKTPCPLDASFALPNGTSLHTAKR